MAQLILGNKNYSSWSLRGWLALRWTGVAFDEDVVPLQQPGSDDKKGRLSPSGLVPAMHLDDGTVIWDSLSIAEWAHEQTGKSWPEDATLRAIARSVASEMHSGFSALRQTMPMNLGRRALGYVPSEGAQADIARILTRWESVRTVHGAGGPFLFGARCFADAMFVPVAARFETYGVELSGVAKDYAAALLADEHVQQWVAAARAEPWTIPLYDG